MNERLTTSSYFLSTQTLLLFVAYFVIRFLSFLLTPHPIVQGLIVFTLILAFATLYFKDPILAWQMLLAELFLGGAGHFFELATLSLRTVLVGTFVILWTLHHISNSKLTNHVRIDKRIAIPLGIFSLYLVFSVFNALANGHSVVAILQDLTPYFFFLLLFPLQQLFHNQRAQAFLIRLFIVYILATAIFMLTLFLLYSHQILEIHEPFYKWFRDMNGGKITDMQIGFFRIVEQSHLLIVPSILFISSLLMKNEKHNKMWRVLLFAACLILAVNLSRIYIIALAAGWLVLLYKHSIYKWFSVGVFTLTLFITVFSGLAFLGSGGQTLGWELFGVRLASVAQPLIETSSATRMTLLNPILEKIEKNPLFGQGPGATVTFIEPVNYTEVTTRQFDWGYLEMITEYGVVGTILFLVITLQLVRLLIVKIEELTNYHDFHVGLLAALISMMVINITSPALFHVFGILFLIFILVIAIQHHSMFDGIVTTLYRIFNRVKE